MQVDRDVRGTRRRLERVEDRVEVLLHLGRVLVAVLRVLRERLEDDLVDALADTSTPRADGGSTSPSRTRSRIDMSVSPSKSGAPVSIS